jgi:hypothetical protein
MNPVTLSATFDGQFIQLDQPCPPTVGTRIVVTVLPDGSDPDRDEFLRFAAQNLARAYGNNEPEYTPSDLKKQNPLYRPTDRHVPMKDRV